MSEEGNDQVQDQENEQLKNLKAEFDRKQGNIDEQLRKLQETNQLLVEAYKSQVQQSKAAPSVEEDEDLVYSNPAEYKRRLKEELKGELTETIQSTNAAQAERQNALVQLTQEYPELADANSAFTKKAIEILGTLPKAQQESAMGYKLAVFEAASKMGIAPASARDEGQDFSIGSGKGSGSIKKQSSGEDISEATLVTAQLFGMDIEDPEYKKRLKKAAKRKNWGRWE